MLEPGRQLDRYIVDALIGEGGMAQVYRVRHATLDSTHALKVLTLTQPSIRDRLIAEGRAQAGLRHPNALTVTDVIDVDGAPGLVMEYVDGPTLEEWLPTNPSLEDRLRVFRQILSALAAAHKRGWVHRDLKPANVLLASGEHGYDAKVVDFGLVKAVAEEPVRQGATKAGTTMGTPAYMAPEQINDAASVTPAADVFSLGCMLCDVLTGKPAFAGHTTLDTFKNIANGNARPLPDRLDRQFGAIYRKALATDVADRYADAGAMLRALDGETGSIAVHVAPPSNAKTTAGLAAATLIAMGVAAVLFILLTGAVLFILWSDSEAPPVAGGGRPTLEDATPPNTTGEKTRPDDDAGASDGTRACVKTGEATSIGWAKFPKNTVVLPGNSGQPALKDIRVYTDRTAQTQTCVLPSGSRLFLRGKPTKTSSSKWMQVFGDNFQLP